MAAYIRNTLTYVWAFLVSITVASWWLSQYRGAEYQVNAGVTAGVLVIAFIKVRFVIWHFMEVKSAPAWLRRTCDGWLLAVALMLFIFYGMTL